MPCLFEGRQFLSSSLPDANKEPERKKSKRKKKRAQQETQEEKKNDPNLHPPRLYSSGYIRAKIVIEGDFPLAAPDNSRSRVLSRKKKKKNHNSATAFELPLVSGMLRYDDISSKSSKRSLKKKPESQKIGRHPFKSKVAPEMIKHQDNDTEINKADHSNINDRDAQESTDIEINNRNYSDVDERHAAGINERQQTDVETSYGNLSFVNERTVPGSTERQRHLVEICNTNDSDVDDLDG
ncbi:hypothetical protein CHS0354_010186 [Potamilus streckersoni]|uniref:Uncharacterized protein n=1 Tax=Potamilus streckersoni TaxID=2493646 RepID=A0AAE0VJB2_9BIVA|nr:hypothetical protein CHS0354_010186 [Potamilus streckersoni]